MPKSMDRPGFTEAEMSEARRAVETAVRRVVECEHPADEAMVTEPVHVGANITVPRPLPLFGIRAARLVRSQAGHELRAHVKRARSQGIGWDDIADALVEPSRDPDDNLPWRRVERAFLEVADFVGSRDYAPSLSWKCASCGQLVTEKTPGYGDRPAGHADDCARHTAELAAAAARTEE